MSWEVRGRAKGVDGSDPAPLVLRRFREREAAARHALTVDMAVWDDVWIAESAVPDPPAEPTAPPPFPWSVYWAGGYAYIIDATGKKIASLLGSQKQREFVAGVLIDLTKIHGGPA